MTVCRTPEEAFLVGWDEAKDVPPLSQDQADYVAAVLAPHWPGILAAREQAEAASAAVTERGVP